MDSGNSGVNINREFKKLDNDIRKYQKDMRLLRIEIEKHIKNTENLMNDFECFRKPERTAYTQKHPKRKHRF